MISDRYFLIFYQSERVRCAVNAAMASTSSDNGVAPAAVSTVARNATHAAKVRGWLEESVAFGDRESALFELDAIVRLCDRHAIEFSDFAAGVGVS